MLKKTVTYTDYLGNPRTEDLHFNLSKTEILELDLNIDGGMVEWINKMTQAQNVKEIIFFLKKILLTAYGERSADGRQFKKKDANGHRLSDAFEETEAYSELFVELLNDTDKLTAFINGIVPQVPTDARAANMPIVMPPAAE